MPDTDRQTLFSPFSLGGLELKNRVVMASMTRGRARNDGLIPTPLHVEYYRQRASAGLIMTEATWVSRESIGFINVPGLFTAEQAEGWRAVTDAVHAEGGRIYSQLAHSGAGSHPDFFKGEPPLGPSAINPGLKSFTPEGFKDTVTPRAMTVEQVKATIADYAAAAHNARAAGFDGVELHSATTYLLPEFLNSALNVRQDEYGGSPENRARIVVEILEALIGVWGPGRVGIKISPTMAMGGFGPTGETVATYDYLVERLNNLVAHPEIQEHRHKKEQEDSNRENEMIRLLPEGFLYHFEGMVDGPNGPAYRLTFKPNPGFQPPDREAEVYHGMAGELCIDQGEERIVKMQAQLIDDVNFGWGILGKLYKGGSILVEQKDVGEGHWEGTHMKLNLHGKALMIKPLSFETTEDATDFEPVPRQMSYKDAVHMLLSDNFGRSNGETQTAEQR